ncbi:DUF6111 family protein [Xanthobacter sp. VNH20]|uniref:DUF6111 family protein n=1 Tax=Xanthobacteraceae TaxID=335928 RepID=UPI0032B3541A
MLRTLLIEGGLFLTPFVLYALLLLVTRGSILPAEWSPRMMGVLSVIAIALMALGLLAFEHGRGAPPGTRYIPAEVKDGVLVPGRFE